MSMISRSLTICFFFLITPIFIFSQVSLNELSSTGGIEDYLGEDQDWIELYNAGPSAINLNGYGLSDDPDDLQKFVFETILLGAGEHLVVLATGANNVNTLDQLDLFIDAENEWQYLVTANDFPANWETLSYDDLNWDSGPGGFGYGDEDDGTDVPAGTIAVLMRQKFEISDLVSIENLKLYMDYDDGFIAFINGIEVARSANLVGQNPGIDAQPSFDHEAGLYAGIEPEVFGISESIWSGLLLEGENVLAIEIHNQSEFSSDLSSNAFLIAQVTETPINPPSDLWWLEGVSGANTYINCPFKLSQEGETIYLSDPGGTVQESVEIPELFYQYSFAKQGGNTWCITDQPSPENNNPIIANCAGAFAERPIIETEPGFYNNQVQVVINHADPNAVIRYTLSGDIPEDTDNIYTGPIALSNTAVVSARAFTTGQLGSPVTKSTFFLNDDNQGIPTISISTNFENLWDNDTGIYVLGDDYQPFYPFFGANFWEPWERVSYFEFFDENKTHAFELEFALEIHGGWSRAEDQKGLRIDTKQNLGGHIDYPLIPAKGGITDWNNFNLRNGGQTYANNRMQDAFIARLVKDTEIDASGFQPCQVFLNGEYWGIHGIREKMDEAYIQVNHGYDSDNVNLIGAFQQLSGSPDDYQGIVNYATTTNPSSSDFLSTISAEVDLQNMTDYFATEIHVQNLDWNAIAWGENNIKVWKANVAGSKWRYMMYDLDGGLGNFGVQPWENYIELAINPSEFTFHSALFGALLENTTYRNYFVNRYADLINSIFQPYQYETVAQEIKDEMTEAMPRHIDRWNAPESIDFWNFSVNNMLGYLEDRIFYGRNHIQNQFNLNSQIEVTLNANPPEAGSIKISTIYNDSNPWTGIYFEGVPIQITAIPNPGYSFVNWNPNDHLDDLAQASHSVGLENDDTFTANFIGQAIDADLIISEINYHSNDDYDAGDWIEIYNRSNVEISLADWVFQDQQFYNTFTFSTETSIPSNGLIVLCNDLEKFQLIHPNVTNVYGDFNFGLSNNGDKLNIIDKNGVLVFSMEYDDETPWPTPADGAGYTLELFDVSTNDFSADSWISECLLGTPGVLYNADCATVSTNHPNRLPVEINLFPNPASEYFILEVKSSTLLSSKVERIQLFDILGKEMKSWQMDLGPKTTFPIPNLATGVYFLKVEFEGQVISKRLIIQ